MRLSTIINNSEQFLHRERDIITRLLRLLGHQTQGISFYWCEAMNADNGVLGAFIPKYQDRIYLQKPDKLTTLDRLKLTTLLPTQIDHPYFPKNHR